MHTLVSNLANINHIDIIETGNGTWKPLYAFLCGVCSEYALNKLKVKNDDQIYRQIYGYYVRGDSSSKELLDFFKLMDDFSPLVGKFDFNDTSAANYERIINLIEWDSTDAENVFKIDGFSFKSPHTFVIQHAVNDLLYFLLYSETGGTPEYYVFQCDNDDYDYVESAPKIFIEDGNKPFPAVVELMDDETFFNLTNDLRTADQDQRAAIKAGVDKNLLIIAGAGSGKTRSLVGRLSYLHLVKQIPVNRIKLLSYTNAATEKMTDAAKKQIRAAGVGDEDINGSTIDSFFKNIISEYWQYMGFAKEPKFCYGDKGIVDRMDMFERVLDEVHMLDLITEKKTLKSLYGDVIKSANGLYVGIPGIESILELLIEKQIEESCVIDFIFTGLILNKVLEKSDNVLYEKICEKYDCILIDEFQDVSRVQNDVLSRFYDSNIHFTFVGDDDQSIYGFSGSDNDIIKGLREDGSCTVVLLSVNYRSNPNIVNAGNDILEKISNRSKNDVKIKPFKDNGSRIHISKYNGNFLDLAHEIKRIYYMGDYDDKICVLFRAAKKFGQFTEALKRFMGALDMEGIPYIYKSNDDGELSEGYMILKSLLFIYNKDMRKKNLDYLVEISNSDITTIDLYNLLCGKSKKQMTDYRDNEYLYLILRLAEYVNLKTGFVKDFVSLVSNYCRAYSELKEGNKSPDRFTDDVTLKSFYKFVEGNDWSYPLKHELLESVFNKFEDTIISRKKREKEPDKKSVYIDTIHGAKGLEYNTVFVAELNDGDFPLSKSKDKKEESDKRIKELKKAAIHLSSLRSTITDDTITELVFECNIESELPNISEAFAKMRKVIEKNRRHLRILNMDGINEYLDAFPKYVESFESYYKDKMRTKDAEICSFKNQLSAIEEMTYDLDDTSDEYRKYSEKKTELNYLESITEQEINKLDDQLNEYKRKLAHLYNFRKKCIQAKNYHRQNKLADQENVINERLQKEIDDEKNEEMRLFYVAVSRAIDTLYLCYDREKRPSEYIDLINKDYCDNYQLMTRQEDEETERLRSFIDDARKITIKEEPEDEETDNAINAIVENSNVGYLINYLKNYLDIHPQFKNLPQKASIYFNKAIQMIGLSERLGVNLRIEILFNLERFIHLFLSYYVGNEVKYISKDMESSESIGADIRKQLREKCKIERVPSLSYFTELFTLPPRYDKLSKCKNIVFESYVICSDLFEVPNDVVDSWNIQTIKQPEEYMCAAIDLINMRNEMVHSNDNPWMTDYLPYAFSCIEIIMNNIKSKDRTKQIDRKTVEDFIRDGFTSTDLRYMGYTAKELKDAGCSIDQLKDAGYASDEVMGAGYDVNDLVHAGMILRDKINDVVALKDLRKKGATAKQLKELGVSPDLLKGAGYLAGEMYEAGFSAELLYWNLRYPVPELKKAGCTAKELKEAGASFETLHYNNYSVKELLEAGFPISDFKRKYYSLQEMLDAGCTLEQLREGGYNIK